MVTDSHSPIFQIMYARYSEHRVLRVPVTGLSLYYIVGNHSTMKSNVRVLETEVDVYTSSGIVTEIICLESWQVLLSLILRTLSRLLLRTQHYLILKTARRINIS